MQYGADHAACDGFRRGGAGRSRCGNARVQLRDGLHRGGHERRLPICGAEGAAPEACGKYVSPAEAAEAEPEPEQQPEEEPEQPEGQPEKEPEPPAQALAPAV